MIKNNKLKVILLGFILFVISFIFIIIKGDIYILEVPINNSIKNIDDIDINIDQNKKIMKIVDKHLSKNILKIKIKGLNKGKSYLIIGDINDYQLYVFYVHNFNIITFNQFLGMSNGDKIIPISIIILLLYIIYLLIRKCKKSIKDSIYQYKNIAIMGVIIFLLYMLITECVQILNYHGLIDSIENLLNSFHMSIILLPVVFISFIFVTTINIKLLIKEGITLKNILGVLMGMFLCIFTLLPEILYKFTYNSFLINIHNMNSISYYIYTFLENLIYIIISYFECILLGTIVIGIISFVHKVKYDKDYIIILGCKIRHDGTLTPLLKGRVDKALDFYYKQKVITGKKLIFIPSGGKGSDEVISEAQAISNYLQEQGISKKQIILEDKSTNTYENIKFSYNLINNKNSKIVFSTTKYHVFRAGIIANKENIMIEGIGSNTKLYFMLNAFIREFIATLYSERKKHFLVLLMITLFSVVIIILIGISNNL